jgi:hypothetical protein
MNRTELETLVERIITKVLREDKLPKLKLIGNEYNAFAILGAAKRVATQNHMDWEAIKKEATSGDYDNLLVTMMKYFDVE